MSGNRGLNGNQNHSCRGISTKVSQPPGGSSSISFGDGGNSHSHKHVSRNQAPAHNSSKPPMQRKQQESSGYGQKAQNLARRSRSNSEDVGNDSLDSAMQAKKGGVPGLEAHYDNYASSNSGGSGRVGQQAKMSPHEYAAALQAQISAKRMLGVDDNSSSYRSNSGRDRHSGRNSGSNYDSGNNSYNPMDGIGGSNDRCSYGRGQSTKMSSMDYAAALKAQIESRPMNDGLTANIGARDSQRGDHGRNNNNNNYSGGSGYSGGHGGGYDNGAYGGSAGGGGARNYGGGSYNGRHEQEYKENSFPGMTGGGYPRQSTKCTNPPGGASSLQLC